MSAIVVDGTLRTKLLSLTQPTRVCDETGNELGQFIPKADLSQWEFARSPASKEELDQRAGSTEKRYTYAEVKAHLERQ